MAKVRTTFLVLATAAALAGGNASGQTPAKPAPPKADAKPAAPKAATAPKHSVVASAADVKWGPAPPSLPPGAQLAVLDGDPSKAAPFVIRAKFPDGYRIAPHWHPTDENVAVMSGTFSVGMGEKANEGTMTALTQGGFAHMPKTMRHYAMAKGETIIQISGTGPFVVNYVNPSDDPRHTK